MDQQAKFYRQAEQQGGDEQHGFWKGRGEGLGLLVVGSLLIVLAMVYGNQYMVLQNDGFARRKSHSYDLQQGRMDELQALEVKLNEQAADRESEEYLRYAAYAGIGGMALGLIGLLRFLFPKRE